jgi:hypothetical protein
MKQGLLVQADSSSANLFLKALSSTAKFNMFIEGLEFLRVFSDSILLQYQNGSKQLVWK